MTEQIAITFDLNQLSGYTDEFLATLWHVAQANPAPHGDHDAGEIASKIGAQVIRRWLAKAPVEMYRHQQRDNYWQALTRLAKYEPGDPDFHAGRWVTKRPLVVGGTPLLDDNGIQIDMANFCDADGIATPDQALSLANAITAALDRREKEASGA